MGQFPSGRQSVQNLGCHFPRPDFWICPATQLYVQVARRCDEPLSGLNGRFRKSLELWGDCYRIPIRGRHG